MLNLRHVYFVVLLLWLIPMAQSQTIHQYKIIIIGAGIAGLESAHYLQTHGQKDFVILEARDRIGGRAWTVEAWNHTHLDLGAGWIAGASQDNPMMQLATAWQLPTKVSDDDDYSLYDANGDEVADNQDHYYDGLYDQFRKFLRHQQDDSNNLQKSVSDSAVAFTELHHLTLKDQAGFIFKVSDNIEQDYAADIRNLSLVTFDNDDAFPGKDRLMLDGYKGIVDAVATGLSDHILLRHVVNKIDYTHSHALIVYTSDGQEFHSEYVICTIPIGVLQKNTVQFVPELPNEKLMAIKNHIGVGIFNRIIMLFPKIFWDKTQYIERISPSYWSGNKWIDKGQWIQFLNMNYYIQKPILTALVSGDFAAQLEHQSDAKIISNIMHILRSIYGEKIPDPKAYLITRWGKDPYSMGSYSSLRPGALADGYDYRIMAKPVGEYLIFAGEGTNVTYPATMFGAYLSGERAAQFILSVDP